MTCSQLVSASPPPDVRRDTEYYSGYNGVGTMEITNTFPGGLAVHGTKLTEGRQEISYPDGSILFEGGDTHLFGYVLGDPVNNMDQDGKVVPLLIAGGIIVAGGALTAADAILITATVVVVSAAVYTTYQSCSTTSDIAIEDIISLVFRKKKKDKKERCKCLCYDNTFYDAADAATCRRYCGEAGGRCL